MFIKLFQKIFKQKNVKEVKKSMDNEIEEMEKELFFKCLMSKEWREIPEAYRNMYLFNKICEKMKGK